QPPQGRGAGKGQERGVEAGSAVGLPEEVGQHAEADGGEQGGIAQTGHGREEYSSAQFPSSTFQCKVKRPCHGAARPPALPTPGVRRSCRRRCHSGGCRGTGQEARRRTGRRGGTRGGSVQRARGSWWPHSLSHGPRVSGKPPGDPEDRKSTRLNSSHVKISYAVFCLKKKTL